MQNKTKTKDCGVLLHISSLPSAYGIGDLGKNAYKFADFLHEAGQTYWQVLPLGPTSYGDSPYQSPSVFAGNPYFIDIEALRNDGLLTEKEVKEAAKPVGNVNYEELFRERMPLLRKAYGRFKGVGSSDYKKFCEQNEYWLEPYALFCALKEQFGLKPHWEWAQEYRNPHGEAVKKFAEGHGAEIGFVRFLQYIFDSQWHKLKTYVNSLGIKIIGDAPIYAAHDSADFWENPQLFSVDEYGNLTEVAGVPPDYFCADGQLWGNPLYNWDYLRAHGYDFWIKRIARSFQLFDVMRIDHFRGFCGYYAVPAGSENARNGEWKKGPGKELFDSVKNALGKVNIIAEDLGVDSPELRELLAECGYPGMKVVQFGFGGAAVYNAHAVKNFAYNYIGYTGTHDNDTSAGWFSSLSAEERKKVRGRLPKGCGDISKAMICALMSSPVHTAIVPMQDWLREGSEARMNAPGTLGNWQYRLRGIPPQSLAEEMKLTAQRYKRLR